MQSAKGGQPVFLHLLLLGYDLNHLGAAVNMKNQMVRKVLEKGGCEYIKISSLPILIFMYAVRGGW
jgi:hypothetical protein